METEKTTFKELFGKMKKYLEEHQKLATALDYVKTILITAIVVIVTFKVFLIKINVPTASMENTIMTGDSLIGFRHILNYNRGDVLMFWPPYATKEDEPYIKRLIGLPGEKVMISGGVVYIDGEPLPENYLPEDYFLYPELNVYTEMEEVTVPEGEYFFLGDNRNSSSDARIWQYKFVKKEDIMAKAVIDLSHFKLLGKQKY